MSRKILVTSALPYANGSIHLGHLVEYIQTDIWVRFQKMQGNTCYYVCADDTHGTPIMLRAEKEGITPEQLIDRVWHEHKADFDGFHVEFDHYGSTNSAETKEFAQAIYRKLKAAGLIEVRSVEQFYDPVKNMFLPDRFIKGECPKCHAKDQYGDNCEACGTTYSPTELINPYSAVSGAQPERRNSDHYFFKLSADTCQEFLREWTRSGYAATRSRQQDAGMAGQRRREQTHRLGHLARRTLFRFRDTRCTGQIFLRVAGCAGGLYGQLQAILQRQWHQISTTTGNKVPMPSCTTSSAKDILYFHALFWPAMLQHAGFRTPTKLFAHGFLTVNGEKMSKSRGTFITADSYLKQGLNPEYLRYYYAAKLNGTMEDLDLNLEDFVAKVNSDLIGKYVNIASRCAGFITNRFGGKITSLDFSETTEMKFSSGISQAGPRTLTRLVNIEIEAEILEKCDIAFNVGRSYKDT